MHRAPRSAAARLSVSDERSAQVHWNQRTNRNSNQPR